MASVIAFIKVFAVLVLLVLAVVIIADFLYKRFFDKTHIVTGKQIGRAHV